MLKFCIKMCLEYNFYHRCLYSIPTFLHDVMLYIFILGELKLPHVGDARRLALGCKSRIFISLKVSRTKRHYF